MRRVRVGAVALGVVVGKATFLVLVGALSAILSTSSTAFSITALLLGTSCTTLGAYVAAVRAHGAFVTHGLLVSAVGFAISFARYSAFTINPPAHPGAVHSLSWELMGWSLLAVAGVLGGVLAKSRGSESAV